MEGWRRYAVCNDLEWKANSQTIISSYCLLGGGGASSVLTALGDKILSQRTPHNKV